MRNDTLLLPWGRSRSTSPFSPRGYRRRCLLRFWQMAALPPIKFFLRVRRPSSNSSPKDIGTKEIADVLSISFKTVEAYRTSALRKFNVSSTVDLVRYVILNKLVELLHVVFARLPPAPTQSDTEDGPSVPVSAESACHAQYGTGRRPRCRRMLAARAASILPIVGVL